MILGEGKSPEHLAQILWGLHADGHGAVISRITAAQRRRLRPERKAGLPLTFLAGGRVAQLAGPVPKAPPGVVAILTAGTADVPVAEEAREVLRGLGVEVRVAYDVGVAGLHRLLGALRTLARVDPDVFIAFAGREGALPTVLAGLVRAPVIAVPTSVGYGRGGHGEAALNALLQACSPVAVVNIDASVPAALLALQILDSAARPRQGRRARAPTGARTRRD